MDGYGRDASQDSVDETKIRIDVTDTTDTDDENYVDGNIGSDTCTIVRRNENLNYLICEHVF